MRNRSNSAATSVRSSSTSDLKRGLGVWIWSARPATIVASNGDGTYEVEYIGTAEASTTVDRNDLDPMDASERAELLSKPRLEPDRGSGDSVRTPLRKFMDEWPISRAQLVKALGFSPPKVDRLIADHHLTMEVAALVAATFDVEVDHEVLHERDQPNAVANFAAVRKAVSKG